MMSKFQNNMLVRFLNCVLKTILEHVNSQTNMKAMNEFIPFLDKSLRTEFSMP